MATAVPASELLTMFKLQGYENMVDLDEKNSVAFNVNVSTCIDKFFCAFLKY